MSTIKCDLNIHCPVKTVFSLLSAIFFKLPITQIPDSSNLFMISVEGSSYRKSTVIHKKALSSSKANNDFTLNYTFFQG